MEHPTSRLITFRISAEDHRALLALSSAQRCSLSEFVRSNMHSVVLDSEVFLGILEPGAGAGRTQAGQPGEGTQQPILSLLVELQQHARALESRVRRLALTLSNRMASAQGTEMPVGREQVKPSAGLAAISSRRTD